MTSAPSQPALFSRLSLSRPPASPISAFAGGASDTSILSSSASTLLALLPTPALLALRATTPEARAAVARHALGDPYTLVPPASLPGWHACFPAAAAACGDALPPPTPALVGHLRGLSHLHMHGSTDALRQQWRAALPRGVRVHGGVAVSTLAQGDFEYPSGVCADGAGGVLVADSWHSALKRISPAGAVSTVAEGLQGISSVALHPSGDALVVAALAGQLLRVCLATGLVSPFATCHGHCLAVDPRSRDVYVADSNASVVRRICGATGGVSVLAHSAASFQTPAGLAVDAAGCVVVADSANHLIRRIFPATGRVSTIAGSGQRGAADGAAEAASFDHPSGVALDRWGNVYVADQLSCRVRRICAATGRVSTVAGSENASHVDGAGGDATFCCPYGLAVEAETGAILVADTNNHAVRRIVQSEGQQAPVHE
jgi:DNA-binding beta-propeller fold protein YncE